VLDTNDEATAHRRPGKRGRAGDGRGVIDRFCDRRRYRKKRAAADIGVEGNAVVEDARKALDDRQSQSKAARNPRALLQPVELLEDLAALENGNANAGVINADLQRLAVAPAPDQHAPAR